MAIFERILSVVVIVLLIAVVVYWLGFVTTFKFECFDSTTYFLRIQPNDIAETIRNAVRI